MPSILEMAAARRPENAPLRDAPVKKTAWRSWISPGVEKVTEVDREARQDAGLGKAEENAVDVQAVAALHDALQRGHEPHAATSPGIQSCGPTFLRIMFKDNVQWYSTVSAIW